MRGRAISQFLDDLSNGDPVAVGLLCVVLAIAAGLGLVVWKLGRDMKREDDAKANRWKRKT